MGDQLIDELGVLQATLRRTSTWDRGSDMAKHAEVTAALGTLVYFCDSASPWQRASNENANDLLRQYFRKGTEEQAEVRFAADEINGRPRAVLDWDSATARVCFPPNRCCALNERSLRPLEALVSCPRTGAILDGGQGATWKAPQFSRG